MPDVLGSVASLIEKAGEAAGVVNEAGELGGDLNQLVGGVLEAAKESETTSVSFCNDYMEGLVTEGMPLLTDRSTLDLSDVVSETNKDMADATKAFKDEVKDILNGSSEPESTKGEVVYTNGEWLVDDIDDATKEWLNDEGEVGATESFTEEEEAVAHDFTEDLFNEAQRRDDANVSGGPSILGAMNEVGNNKEDREALQLLLRIAIKVGTKVAVATAGEIAKDKDTPKELRIALGLFADLAGEGGRLAEKMITGEERPDLGKDCIKYVTSRFSSKQAGL
jgi:hypothetical protein